MWTKNLTDALDMIIREFGFENEITLAFCDMVETGWLSEWDMLGVADDLLEQGADSIYMVSL